MSFCRLIVVLSVILAFVASHLAAAESKLFDDFNQWKAKYNRNYDSHSLENKAFRVWLLNKDIVESINAANLTWTASLGVFGDMTSEDFKKNVLLPAREYKQLKEPKPFSKKVGRPDEFDWRSTAGVVTSVKDQGSVGSCWAFSTVGNIEGQWAMHGSASAGADLSPEFLVDCDGSHDDKHADCSVFGGWPYLAYGYVIEAGGIPTEADWPYCAGTGDCYPCMQGPVNLCGPPPYYCDRSIDLKCINPPVTAKISDWTSISTDENEIADALYSIGPLSVLLDATQLQFYDSGIWTGHLPATSPLLGCSKQYLDHAVLMVGYGTESSQEYWTVKNSWGTKWGESGYFRIVRNQGTCGINTGVTTSIV